MAINFSIMGSLVPDNFNINNVFNIYVAEFKASEWLPYSRWNDQNEEYIKIKNDGTPIQFSDVATGNRYTNLITNPRINIVHKDPNNYNEYVYDGCYYTWLYNEFGSDYNTLKLYARNNLLYELDFSNIQNLGFTTDVVSSIYLVVNIDVNGEIGGLRPIVGIGNQYYIICPLIPQSVLNEWKLKIENTESPEKKKEGTNKIPTSSGSFNIGLNYPPTRTGREYLNDVMSRTVRFLDDCATVKNCLVYDYYFDAEVFGYNSEYNAPAFNQVETGLLNAFAKYESISKKTVLPATNFVGYKTQSSNFVNFLSSNNITFDRDFFPFDFKYEDKRITVSITTNNELKFDDHNSNTVEYDVVNLLETSRSGYTNLNANGAICGLYIVKVDDSYELWCGLKFNIPDTMESDTTPKNYNSGIYAISVLPDWLADFMDEAGIGEDTVVENETTESLVEDELGGELGTGELVETVNNDTEYNPHDGTMGNGTGSVHEGDEHIPDPEFDLPVAGGEGSVLGSGFIKVYTPTKTQLDDFTSELLSDNVLDILKDYFTTNPMEGIIGLSMLPYTGFSSNTHGNPKIGTHKFDSELDVAGKEYLTVDYGTIDVKFSYDGYENYSQYSDCKIFLPHIGYKEIDIDMVQGCRLHLKYLVSLVTGDIYAYLYAKWVSGKDKGANNLDHLLYHWQGNCNMTVPVTHVDKSSYVNGAIQAAGNIASIVSGGVTMNALAGQMNMTESSGEYAALNKQFEGAGLSVGRNIAGLGSSVASMFKPSITTSGNISGACAYMSERTPYLLLSRPIITGTEDIKRHYGLVTCKKYKISELKNTGYTELNGVDLNGVSATEEELNELKSILEGGYYA